MPTRNVVLSDHLAALVARLVESGRYQNASEVMREGLRLVERREAEDAIRLKAMPGKPQRPVSPTLRWDAIGHSMRRRRCARGCPPSPPKRSAAVCPTTT